MSLTKKMLIYLNQYKKPEIEKCQFLLQNPHFLASFLEKLPDTYDTLLRKTGFLKAEDYNRKIN